MYQNRGRTFQTISSQIWEATLQILVKSLLLISLVNDGDQNFHDHFCSFATIKACPNGSNIISIVLLKCVHQGWIESNSYMD